jgi:hypothetical protein
VLRTLAASILILATPLLGAQSTSTSNLKEAISVIVLFCVAGGEKFELTGDVSAEGGLLLKKAGASAQGSLRIAKSEAKGLVEGLNKELSNVNAAQASEARACMKPYIDRILSLLIGEHSGAPSRPQTESPARKEPGRTAVPSEAQRRPAYVATIGTVTRTHDGTTISMTSMREYGAGRLGANFYVDGKSGMTSFPGQRVPAKKTRDTECYFELLSLEGDHKAPSTATANLEYTCTKL